MTTPTTPQAPAQGEAEVSYRPIGEAELKDRIAKLRETNFVFGSLMEHHKGDFEAVLAGFANRPDLRVQVLEKLQIREVTLYVDTALAAAGAA